MAKTPRPAKKPALQSSTKKAENKADVSKMSDAALARHVMLMLAKAFAVSAADVCGCQDSPDGTIKVCQGGTCEDVPPPTYPGYLAYSPDAPGGLPYYERIANAVGQMAKDPVTLPTLFGQVTMLLNTLLPMIPSISTMQLLAFVQASEAVCAAVMARIATGGSGSGSGPSMHAGAQLPGPARTYSAPPDVAEHVGRVYPHPIKPSDPDGTQHDSPGG